MVVYYYVIVVVLTVCISSVALAYLLNKKSMLNLNTILSISLSSVAIGLMIPYLLGSLLNYYGGFSLVFTLLATLLIYILLTLLMSILISSFSDKIESIKFIDKVKVGLRGKLLSFIIPRKNQLEVFSQDGSVKVGRENDEFEIKLQSEASNESFHNVFGNETEEVKNILEKSVDSKENIDTIRIEIIAKDSVTSADLLSENGNNVRFDSEIGASIDLVEPEIELFLESDVSKSDSSDIENLLVRFVAADVNQLHDELEEIQVSEAVISGEVSETLEQVVYDETAVGIEPAISCPEAMDIDKWFESSEIDEIETLSIEECIDRAFRFKQSGDLEDAILSLMQALDKGPDSQLIFWIVLDICAMYRTLGQTEFAKGMLEGYLQDFEDQMDLAVKSEIQKIYSNI